MEHGVMHRTGWLDDWIVMTLMGGREGGGNVRRGNQILSKVRPQSRFVAFGVCWIHT